MYLMFGNFLPKHLHNYFYSARCTVFVKLPINPEPVKLLRDEPTVIFDYCNWFEPSLQQHISDGVSPLPSAEVMISFGQKWTGGETEFRNNLIWSKICLQYADQQLCRVSQLVSLFSVFSDVKICFIRCVVILIYTEEYYTS